jgi:transposase
MANQLKMAETQAILALWRSGWSLRRIARELGVNRETVGRYVRLANQRQLQLAAAGAAAGALDDEPLTTAGAVAAAAEAAISKPASALTGSAALSEPNPASALTGNSGQSALHLSAAWPWRELIEAKLDQGLSSQRIYQDLTADHGYSGSYHSVRRLVNRLSASVGIPVRRMECEAGAEAQVDFGSGAPLAGGDGRRRRTWVFRIILSHSRKGYSESVLRQGTDEFLRCLENGFAHFGGVPRTLVIDNLRAAVKRADWFDPELCPRVQAFADHYGTAILPTRPYTPRHKGKVEGGVKYVKGNALRGRLFSSLAEQNRHLQQWEQNVADRRIHGTTRQQVRMLFESSEKPALLALPPSRFELFQEALRIVSRDGHVQVKGAYYSAPPEYLGCRVWARWDGRTVRLFNQRLELIAVHAQKAPGQFATLQQHILPEKISGIERGTTWLLRRIGLIGPQAQAWAQAVLRERGIAAVRVLLGLLSLRQRHLPREIERACRIASSHQSWRLQSLRRLIQDPSSAEQSSFEFASEHPIIRPVADYGQWVRCALSGVPSLTAECSAEELVR